MKLCHEDYCDLYALRYIMSVIKSMRMGWKGHVVRMAEKENACSAQITVNVSQMK